MRTQSSSRAWSAFLRSVFLRTLFLFPWSFSTEGKRVSQCVKTPPSSGFWVQVLWDLTEKEERAVFFSFLLSTELRWKNGLCAFKAPDCLSLCAAERLTPCGHGGQEHHPGEVQSENNLSP